METIVNCSGTKFQSSRPFNNGESKSVQRQKCIASGIIRLFSWCCPSAIARFIIAIIINPIKRARAVWTFTHVVQEGCKIIAPLLTHRNATATVGIKPWTIGVEASLFRTLPTRMRWRTIPSVSSKLISSILKRCATATLCVSSDDIVTSQRHYSTTSTLANPASTLMAIVSRSPKHYDTSKCLADEIPDRHGRILHHFGAEQTGQRAQRLAQMMRTGSDAT